ELEMSCHFQPVQLPGQQRNGRRQRNGDSAPGFGPRNLFHFDLLATQAADAERLVAQFHRTIAHTQVPPCPRFQPAVSSAASGATVTASELALPDSRHMSDDGFIGFLDLSDVVGFHCELFSDKRFHAHWAVGPPGGVATGKDSLTRSVRISVSCVCTETQRNSPATALLKLPQQACRRSINKKYFGVKPIGTGPSGYAAYGS